MQTEDLDEHEAASIRDIIAPGFAQQGDASRSATEDLVACFTQAAFSSLWDSSQEARDQIQPQISGFALLVGQVAENTPASPPGAKRKQADTVQNSPRKRLKTSDSDNRPVLPHRVPDQRCSSLRPRRAKQRQSCIQDSGQILVHHQRGRRNSIRKMGNSTTGYSYG